jgi:hypothetical protein
MLASIMVEPERNIIFRIMDSFGDEARDAREDAAR